MVFITRVTLLIAVLKTISAACPFENKYSRDKCGSNAVSTYGSACACQPGMCCSSAGFCGPSPSSSDRTADYCGQGCQTAYGICANAAPPTCPVGAAYVPNYTVGGLVEEVAAGLPAPLAPIQWCCPLNSPIVSWTLARTDDLTGYFRSYVGAYVGKISATCKDGTVLPAVTYGRSSNGQCKTSALFAETTVSAIPAGGTYSIRNGGVLDNFLGVGGGGGYPGTFSCPTAAGGNLANEVAIGFQASSSCYGIANLKVICAAEPK